ncbi:transposase family protein [Streptomyces sp. NPDC005761]|uniref:transposase family protein n=1 Tax=Streptomyces sp. NPDC005761 TaxID=3157066 RepID=UPI0033E9499E
MVLDSLVFAGISEVEVEAVTAAFGTVEVVAGGRAGGAACPDCDRFSGRVHDRYQRRLRDLPLADQGFLIQLTVRRFICGFADCPRRTFAEPFSRLTVPARAMHHAAQPRTWAGWGSPWQGGPALDSRPSWPSARNG